MADPLRITVKRGDDVALVIEQLIDASADSVIFAIAPGALFGQTLTNFKLLKREAALLKREVIIETADLAIRERAAKAGLGILEAAVKQDDGAVPAARPRRAKSRSVKVNVVDGDEEAAGRSTRGRKSTKAATAVEQGEEQEIIDSEPMPAVMPGEIPERVRRGEPQRPQRKRGRGMWTWIVAAAAIGLVIVLYVAIAVLPKATITVVTEKKTWNFDGNIAVDKALSKIDPVGTRVPGQVFVVKDSITKRVPATGKQYVSRKATGSLTVYNAYSSQPQNIVANTRFVTPAGVVFRITAPLLIPGAKIENGKIIPSSIEAQVVADKAGTASNVAATPRLTIPGFLKSPKYDGFYGELKEGATGGFTGETAVPTDKDVAAAKTQSTEFITQSLQQKAKTSVPEGFTVLDGASKVSITRQIVEPVAASDGTVGVVTDAQLSILGFRNSDVKTLLQDRVTTAVGSDFKVDSETLTYGPLSAKTLALSSGRMLVATNYAVALSHVVSIDVIKQKIEGQPDSKLDTLIFEIPGITGGKVTLWPFYVHTVTSNLEKITVEVQ